jgi:nucleotide-binding universal stress UspA family protein
MLKRILLALDSTESGQVALSFAVALAGPGTAIRVLHINEFELGGRGLTVETAEEAVTLVRGAVTELQQRGIDASGLASVSSGFGIADYIAAEAERWSADGIVLGSCRRRGWRRLLSQGIRERLLRLTCLPVLTAPPPLQVTAPELAVETGGKPATRRPPLRQPPG